jgi:hypothetical protein
MYTNSCIYTKQIFYVAVYIHVQMKNVEKVTDETYSLLDDKEESAAQF